MERKNRWTFVSMIAFLVLVAVLSAWYYQSGAEAEAKHSVERQLSDIAREQADTLNTRLDGQYTLLESCGSFFVQRETIGKGALLESMSGIVENSPFLHMGYVKSNGQGFLNTGAAIDVRDRDYFQEAMAGREVFERVDDGKVSGEPRFVQAIPLRDRGAVIGVLFGSYDERMFKELLKSDAFGGSAVTYLCNSKGEIVIGSDADGFLFGKGKPLQVYDNILDGYANSERVDVEIEQRIAQDLKAGKAGVFDISIQGYARNIIYAPLDLNDWFIVNGVPTEVVAASMRDSTQNALLLLLLIFCCSVSGIIFVVCQEKKNVKAIHAEQEKLRVSEEEYRIASQQSNKIIARYDIQTKILYYHPNSTTDASAQEKRENVPDSLLELGIIAPEGEEDCLRFFEEMRKGTQAGSVEIRMRLSVSGNWCWYHADFTAIYGTDGDPMHTILSFYDISEQREHELAYELWRQNIAKRSLDKTAVFEYNLTRDTREAIYGNLKVATEDIEGTKFNERTDYWAAHWVHPEDAEQYRQFLNLERLMAQFRAGTPEESWDFRAEMEGSYRWMRMTVHMAEYPGTREIKGFLIVEDIDTEKRAELTIKERSETDSLTGVLNRSTFAARVDALLAEAPNAGHVLLMIDLDRFKQINDSFGHVTGDRVLVEITSGLKAVIREGDLLGRLGGDEFMLCLRNIPSTEAVEKRAEFICSLMKFEVANGVYASGSMGVALYPQDGTTFAALYHCADVAAYCAKSNGRNRYEFYRPELESSPPELETTPIDLETTQEKWSLACDERGQNLRYQRLMTRRHEEERYREIMETLQIASYEWDFSDETFSASASFSRYVLSQQSGRQLCSEAVDLSGIHPEDRALARQQLRENQWAKGGYWSTAVRLELTAGGYEPCRMGVIVMKDEMGKMTKYIGIIAVCTEYEQKGKISVQPDSILWAEEEAEAELENLQRIRAQWDYIFQMSAAEAFEIDIQTRRLTLSAGTLTQHAFSSQVIENVPEGVLEQGNIHPDSIEAYRAFYEDIYHGKPEGSCIVGSRRLDGEYVLTRLSFRCLYDRNHQAVRAIGISETLENIADTRLRFEQEEKLHLLIRHDLMFYAKANLTKNTIETAHLLGQSEESQGRYDSYHDFVSETLRCIPNAEERLIYGKTMTREKLLQDNDEGNDWIYRELRICMPDGRILWSSHSAQLLRSPYNGDVYAFLYIRDVNERKKNELALGSRAEFDRTQTFYTWQTMKALVSHVLKQTAGKDQLVGIAVLRISNMNEVIQRFGRSCVDRLMISINRKLRYSLKNNQVTARVGENEIGIFFDKIPSKEWMSDLGDYILDILHNPSFFITSAEQYVAYRTGVALSKAQHATFERLYRYAESATDKADEFTPYIQYDAMNEKVSREDIQLIPLRETIRSEAMSDTTQGDTEDVLPALAQILLAQSDTKRVMDEALAVLGAFYGAERSYILEVQEEQQTLDNTFEWCAQGVVPQIEYLKGIPFLEVPTFQKAYETSHSIIIEDLEGLPKEQKEYQLLQRQGIHSLFAIPYRVEQRVVGFVGVDNPSRHVRNVATIESATYFLMSELFKRRAVERDHYMGRYDLLSGVLSRNSYVSYLNAQNVDTLTSLGVLMVSMSDLKEMNQRLGNEHGDRCVKNTAQILTIHCGREHVYRYGGGTFLVLLPDLSYEAFQERLGSVRLAFAELPYYEVAIGHTWSEAVESMEKLVAEADERMLTAKRERSSGVHGKQAAQRDLLRDALVEAMQEGRCLVYLQPKAEVATLRICGAEALVRMQDPTHGIVLPGRFIPSLEQAGLIRYIDLFVFEEVLRLLARWKEEGRALFPISLNFSRSTLLEPNIIQSMLQITEQYDVARDLVEIEITESMGDLAWETIRQIGGSILEAGFRLSIDDFGSKYSNLSILTSVPFSAIKLDKSLIDRVVSNKMTSSVVESVISLCRQYDIEVVAEGVETAEQLHRLQSLGCPLMQGYYLNKPLPLRAFEEKYKMR